ncbi:MAG: penicillin amidase, partial [Candidatus Hydrogenedentes bacterium]|nr:penicillin amidase [Candidatus Hydrogenedentota bacterium]
MRLCRKGGGAKRCAMECALKAAALFAVLAGVISAAALLALAYTRNPDLDATLHHPSLQAEVRVVRDDWGVPHIQAENETDAYFALGYVMAQDRLFQMDLLRRLARGELAAILGPPLARIDKIIRTFQLRAKAEIIFERNTSATPEIRAAAQAFTDGINHCMQTEPRPFECVVLQIPEEPFTPVDCITVAAILPITFAEGLREDLLASMLKQRHPDLPIDDLFPGYSREIPITIMESLDEAKRYFEENRKTTQAPARNDPVACLDALRVWLDPLADISRRFGPSLGSNS